MAASPSRVAFAISGAAGVASSAYLFRDLADISQWVVKADRDDVFTTFRNRHKFAAVSMGSLAANTYATFAMKPKGMVPVPAWATVNGLSLFLLYSGYVNPEIMMRPRNSNAVYVPSSEALKHLKRQESVIVTKAFDGKPRAFPDVQVLRPHVVRIGKLQDGSQVTFTYCGLTNLGMVFQIAKREDGTDVELVPMTQLENNLIVLDKNSGHIGQQINGVDETALKAKIGAKDFHETKRRLPEKLLKDALHKSEIGKEMATWRMSLGDFVRTYPDGDVFLNDYKMFKEIKNPVKTVYDSLMDLIFETSVYYQATNPNPVFPTLKDMDPRLPPKEQVFAFNVGDDYVALTEAFVRDGKNGLRNVKVGNRDVVASWDLEAGSLGIFYNPTGKPVRETIDVHGKTKSGLQFERVSTVKAGAFWCIVANFFPSIRLNPES